ncbi:long polar fimbrial protein LpfA [Salmonella enterica subsp. enterica serovar Javiana]|nr:fimbrial protein [Salmonella enterica subsp. enterica serovar Wedding]EHR2383247.1 fimbrial protein [Salmonella enterica subsp. enterica serovar Newport]QDI87321.1 long polar fimbrial protein LpfA [Salmonella enterica subsp. enterica serovar Javiana]
MFRKTLLSAATVAAMMSTVPAFADTTIVPDAGQGTIEFTGSVIEAPCSIVPNDQNIQVNLGQVSAKSLASADSHSSMVPVSINLVGCSFDVPTGQDTAVKYSKVAVTFPGAPAPEQGDGTQQMGEIKNTATDNPATKVAIQLLKSDASTPVDLTKTTPTESDADITLDTTSSSNQLKFFARMISVAGGATAGNVGATVTYKLHYF